MSTESKLTRTQYKHFGPRPIAGYKEGAAIWATCRFDDDCGNGHNTFSITAQVREPGRRDIAAGGCLHDEIAAAFPELAGLIKWHLCSTDGPLHYLSNTLYLAGDRDCNGYKAGEPSRFETSIQFGRNPIKHHFKGAFVQFLQDATPHNGRGAYDFEVLPIYHDSKPGEYKFAPKYTFGGYADKWHVCPFDTEQAALDFLTALQTCEPQFVKVAVAWGSGKARELDAARAVAIWPEATDAELTAPDLKQRLTDRLPALLAEFRAAMESEPLSFTW